MNTILVVDDKEMMRDSIGTTLVRNGMTVVTAPSGSVALQKLAERSFNAVITDLQMPEMNGLDLLEQIKQIDAQLPVVLITAYGTIETAVGAMKNGAFDYITKPFTGDVLTITIKRALEHSQLVRDNNVLRASANNGKLDKEHDLIGRSPCISRLRDRIAQLADSQTTVLITGESGSGKEVAARCIHEQSPRAKMPFLAVNCAALSTNLLESELFGHEKGAYTGADKMRKGRFELADGGTLLLDEISEVSPDIQAKLLRVLQERSYDRVGSSVSRSVDVRVIATTNRDLVSEVANGRFREDLYFRLNVLPLHVPPLRDHVEDIPSLVSHFLSECASRDGKSTKTMATDALELLMSYSWPGNVRELQNICERASVLASTQEIAASLISPWLQEHKTAPQLSEVSRAIPRADSMIELSGNGTASQAVDLHSIICDGNLKLADVEREVIVATLEHNHGHRQRSAHALGIGVRTLGLKLKKWKEQQLVDQKL